MKKNKAARIMAPERSKVVLVLIDVINDMDFPKGKHLLRNALPAAKNIARLKARARAAKVPAIYVNDNFGRWQSDFRNQVEYCLGKEHLGHEITDLLQPEENDYFVLKPKHSGFHCTSLEILLEYLGAETLILVGFASNICVLYTANDAYMRDFQIIVASDCVAAETRRANDYTLEQMKSCLKARILSSKNIRFS